MVVFIFGNNAWGDAGADPEAVPGNFINYKKNLYYSSIKNQHSKQSTNPKTLWDHFFYNSDELLPDPVADPESDPEAESDPSADPQNRFLN